MKKFILQLVLLPAFSCIVLAVDTIRVCASTFPSMKDMVIPPIDNFCPESGSFPFLVKRGIGIMNGDTIYQGQPFPIGQRE